MDELQSELLGGLWSKGVVNQVIYCRGSQLYFVVGNGEPKTSEIDDCMPNIHHYSVCLQSIYF